MSIISSELAFFLPFSLIVVSGLAGFIASISSATICFYLRGYSADPDIRRLLDNGSYFTPYLVLFSPVTSAEFIGTLRGYTGLTIGRWNLIRGRKTGQVDYFKEHPRLRSVINIVFSAYLLCIALLLVSILILMAFAVVGVLYIKA
tara:strand:+ start:1024 stop:1461 length:438 start_codon:yes stop_codon:yes gene_type:complete